MRFEQGHTAGRRRAGESRRSAAGPSGSNKAWQKGDRVRTRASLRILAAGAAALAATAIGAAAPAQAASAGSLDPSFGTGGVVTVPADFSPGTMLTQPDGTILVLGTVTNPSTGDAEFGVLKYNANGTLDTSFGTAGQAVATFSGANAEPTSIFVQSDGSIVVAGTEFSPDTSENAAVAEFNANGTLDTSFGSGGEVTTQFPSGNASLPGTDGVNAVLVDANGNILIGGGLVTCSNPKNAECLSEYALALFNPDGTLDTSFGSGGFAVQKAGSDSNSVIALGEDSAGDIFAQYNNVSDTIGDSQLGVGEYSPAGVPDSTVTFPSSSSIAISSAYGFQPNGTYPVGQMVQEDVGSKVTYDAQVLLDSLPTGTASASFNNPPFAYVSGDAANTITGSPVAGSNGDVVLDGWSCVLYKHGVCQDGAPYLAQLTPTGSLDSTFGTGGITTIPISSSGSTDVESPSIQPDGDILVPIFNFVTNAQGITTTTITIDRFLG
jgi:uncharacterized delta-60 repeat protein